jgi:hypothetical protein
MKPQRPAIVTVLAILSIIFGSLGILLSLVGLVGALVMLAFTPEKAAGNASPLDMFATMAEMSAEIKRAGGTGLEVFMIGKPILSVLFCTLWFISGIGLLSMKPWARWGCLAYLAYATLATLADTIVSVVLINPITARVQEMQFKRMGPQFQNNPFVGNATFANAINIMMAVVYLAIFFTLMVLLFLPSVSSAFAALAEKQRARKEDRSDDWEED